MTRVAGIVSRVNATLRGLPSGGKITLGAVAALIAALLGFTIGVAVGRPNYPGEGSADVGFARDMSAHHAQAVEMAMIAYQKATRPDIRTLGGDIATTQQAQIGTMQGWLQTWGVSVNSTDPPMAWVPGGDSMVHDNLMPGMATRDQVEQLKNATGQQVDILFLQLMIQHHLGGIHMVEELLQQHPSPAVRALAENMRTNQTGEVTLMQGLLAELGAPQTPSS
jgi:uncharacterized protein (DUF305 family)